MEWGWDSPGISPFHLSCEIYFLSDLSVVSLKRVRMACALGRYDCNGLNSGHTMVEGEGRVSVGIMVERKTTSSDGGMDRGWTRDINEGYCLSFVEKFFFISCRS